MRPDKRTPTTAAFVGGVVPIKAATALTPTTPGQARAAPAAARVGASAFTPATAATAQQTRTPAAVAPPPPTTTTRERRSAARDLSMDGKTAGLRNRITSVKNTQKITEAMRLVAAAKVRRAQDAVLRTRPFSEQLQKVLGGLLHRLGNTEYFDLPMLKQRPIRKVLVLAISGDRGLCGGHNNYIIKKTQARIRELEEQSLRYELVLIGNKITQWARRRNLPIRRAFSCGQAPTAEQANEIADEVLADYLSDDMQRVELLYTRFVSLISSEPAIRTLLPLTPAGLEREEDEVFQLTTKDGKFAVKTSELGHDDSEQELPPDMIFEQDPVQLLNAMLPLYFNGQLLRTLQESVASELASRMSAMSNASDNAKSLARDLEMQYNRARQAGITQELMEIVSGATAQTG